MTEKKQVLVICRSAAGQMYLGILFNRIWYSPYLAQSAKEGVQIAQNSPFSLIILDGDLADSDLNDELSLLRTDPSVKDLPLIVFVKQNAPEHKEALLSRGCSAVLAKPLDLAQTYAVISNLTGQERKSPRVPVHFLVEIEESLRERNFTCVNISEGGMFLSTPNPLPEKTVIHVKFTLPHGEDPIRAAAVVAAEVVRTAPLEMPVQREPGMGLRFIDVPEHVRSRIREFVQFEMTGDLDEDATL